MFASNTSAANGAATYIEDVFSTYLYTGNGSTQTITNGIDLAGKGGLVWVKGRSGDSSTFSARVLDTIRGSAELYTANTSASYVTAGYVFNSNGFSLPSYGGVNGTNTTYASWTFRKQPKFMAIATWTGNGAASQVISHDLGSVPGFIIVKAYSGTSAATGWWYCYHRSLGNTQAIALNDTGAATTLINFWRNTDPTSTQFTVGSTLNDTSTNFIAYVFAHNAGGFGLTGTDNVISCGSFTTDGSGVATVNLGWEPQWILVRESAVADNWRIFDTMRGWDLETLDSQLNPNLSAAESDETVGEPTATGFRFQRAANRANIYIAIRRGPMKTPTSGTSVFDVETFTGGASTKTLTSGFPPDMTMLEYRSSWNYPIVASRLTGKGKLIANQTDAENTTNTSWIVTDFDSDTGTTKYNDYGGGNLSSRSVSNGFVSWMFRRSPGFFDVVCYTGTGSARTVNHNLTVAPEMMIVKKRNSATNSNWVVYCGNLLTPITNNAARNFLLLNTTQAGTQSDVHWDQTAPTASVFTVGASTNTNSSADTFIAYLFASCPGVSKVGSYTGDGTTGRVINCGFTSGARFVLIKATNQADDWYMWDSARGIVAGNDPYLKINSVAAEVSIYDAVDTDASGFAINQLGAVPINSTGISYIYLAIA